jgi:hypothetical protein
MPYEPYDTGWIKSIYGVLCLTWYLTTSGTLTHLTSATCYNNILIPFIELFNKSCELMGNIIVTFGSGVIHGESIVFKYFNYVDPIYYGITYLERMFSTVKANIGTPTFQSTRPNSRNNKSSTGRHLSAYYARKRLRRRQFVISGSNKSKNDTNIEDQPQKAPKEPPQPDSNTILFHPMNDQSC